MFMSYIVCTYMDSLLHNFNLFIVMPGFRHDVTQRVNISLPSAFVIQVRTSSIIILRL